MAIASRTAAVPCREYTSPGQVGAMLAHYAEVNRRLWSPPAATPSRRAPSGGPVCAWDEQVIATLGADRIYREPRRIIARVAEAHGVTSADITGPSRKAVHFKARLAAVAEVVDLNPNISVLHLGRIFGGRDHTTIENALRHVGRTTARAGIGR